MKKINKNPDTTKLNKIKNELGNFDLVLPGTIRQLYMKCGKSGCACQTNAGARHGPYFLWDRKVGKKLTSKMIPAKIVPLLKKGIQNRKELEKLVQEAVEISQEMAVNIVEDEKKRRDKNHK